MTSTTVAIIGAGPAGLTSLRHALANGFFPTAFEAHSRVGGVWRGDETSLAWKGLPTYFSKHTCAFPDLAHPPEAPLFLNREAMQDYLQRYVDVFALRDLIQLNTKVVAVTRQPSTDEPRCKWSVTRLNLITQETTTSTFDFIVFASGVFAKPYMPSVSAAEAVAAHPRMVTHTSSFSQETFAEIALAHRRATKESAASDKEDDDSKHYSGLKILVVGSSFSGCDIAVTLADGGATVDASFRKSSYLVPRIVDGLPMDAIFYRRTRESHARATGRWHSTEPRIYTVEHERVRAVCADIWQAAPALSVDNPPMTEPPFITVSDRFLPAVAEGRIGIVTSGVDTVKVVPKVHSDDVTALATPVTHKVVVGLRNGATEEYDHVILATGYTTDLSYLDSSVLSTAGYKVGDLLQPLLLYKATLHPDLPTAAFVGLYRGPFFSVMDLQAMWAMSIFAQRTYLPSRDVVMAALDHERQRRHMEPRPQFPHGEYSYFLDELSVEAQCDVVNALTNGVLVEAAGGVEALERLIFDSPTFPQHFRLASDDPRVALKALHEIQGILASLQ